MNYKILAVDDSKTLLEVLEFAFEKHELSVHTTDSLEECKKLISEPTFDVILYDLNFREMDGISFVRFLRKEQKSGTRVFLMANHQKHEIKLSAKEAGADGWILKPFIAELLGKKIRRFIKYGY